LTALVVFGGAAILMAVAVWIGAKRSQDRVSELPRVLRSPLAIGALLLIYIVVVTALLLNVIR
jgi:uncharacterized membrane protein YidH (DUF202 family)